MFLEDGTEYRTPAQGLHQYFVVPDDGYQYAFLRHDWQWAGDGTWGAYKPRSAGLNNTNPNIELPETVHLLPFDKRDFLPLDKVRQQFHLNLLRVANPSVDLMTLKLQWKALTGQSVAFTDRHAWNTGDRLSPPDPTKNFALYALNLNLQNPPIAWKVGISTGGNLVRILEQPNIVEALDWAKPLPAAIDLMKKPWLCHWATIECGGSDDRFAWSQMVDGALRAAWRVLPFPQLRNVYGIKTGTPYPLWGYGGRTR
ncbi:MAG TPA: hypothetical protein VIV60_07640, partial [Polyangiaceae bacterium]